jgi:hypothetical protein
VAADVDAGWVAAGAVRRVGDAERSFLAAMWVDAAADEAAAVASFRQLADELRAVGAPGSLRRTALDAADDEVEHVRLSCLLASQVAGDTAPAVAAPSAIGYRAPIHRSRSELVRRGRVLRLALEAYVDGCGNEGAEVERLAAAADRSDDPASGALRTIAVDEARHAELAWSTIEWAIDELGPGVGRVLANVRLRSPRPRPGPPEAADRSVLAAWGWVDPATEVRQAAVAHAAARRRLADVCDAHRAGSTRSADRSAS